MGEQTNLFLMGKPTQSKTKQMPTWGSSTESWGSSPEPELSMYWDIEMLQYMFERKATQISIDVEVGTVVGWMCAIPEHQEVSYADVDASSESEDLSELESAGEWQ